MASLTPFQTILPRTSPNSLSVAASSGASVSLFAGSNGVSLSMLQSKYKKTSSMEVAAVGELSSDSNTFLIAGAIGVALVGTAFPILFSRRDTCPECDGAGFIRKSGATLRANAARKDEAQIVCARCNGLGKLNQIDK